MPRREPPCPFSEAVAVIKPPLGFDRDALIAFFYGSSDLLQNDYRRAANWKQIPGLKAYVRTIYLEKDHADVAYINFGWRRVPGARGDSKEGGTEPYELPKERIAVKIGWGGNNRGSVVNEIQSAESLLVIFHLLDLHDRGMLETRTKRLYEGTLWCADGTEQIEMKGISIFGRLIRPEGECVEK